jgi:SNF2 family DNA or RNA helicase
MYCTHPQLVQEDIVSTDPEKYSLKYRRMCEILSEIISRKEKVILFTSYTGMFNILLSDIPSRFHIPVYSINGATPVEERQPTVDTFSAADGSALLVLNPRAAGTGLNITAANYVIHYNLEWNPALEDQASARAYRRGQTKTVFVYRLFYADTVEEVVNNRIELKRALSDTAVIGVTGKQENRDDILKALLLSPKEARK